MSDINEEECNAMDWLIGCIVCLFSFIFCSFFALLFISKVGVQHSTKRGGFNCLKSSVPGTVVGVNTLPGTYSTVLYKYCMFGKENISQQQQYCSLLSVILYVRVLCSDRLEYQYLLLVPAGTRRIWNCSTVVQEVLFTEMQHLFYLLLMMKNGQAEDHHTPYFHKIEQVYLFWAIAL